MLIEPLTYIFNLDIDECVSTTNKCDKNANCSNIAGSFSCSCEVGYSGDGETCQGMLTILGLQNDVAIYNRLFVKVWIT